MLLPTDLVIKILYYFKFKKLQLINDAGYSFTDNTLITLLKTAYNIDNNVITTLFTNKTATPPLTRFDLFTNIIMLAGNSGYNGQFYLPPYVALLYAIRDADIELIDYYFLRYNTGNPKQTLKNLGWPLEVNYLSKINYDSFIPFMLSINKSMYNYLIKYLSTYYSKNEVDKYLSIKSVIDRNASEQKVEKFYDNENVNYYYMTAFKKLDATNAIISIRAGLWIRDVDPDIVVNSIIFSTGYITNQHINNARAILDVLNTVRTGMYGERYKGILEILCGQIPDYIANLARNAIVNSGILTLAFAVMNDKVIDKLIEIEAVCEFYPLSSEVLYDITILNKLVNSTIYDNDIKTFVQTAGTISLYLSNLALYSNITNNKINMITILNNKYKILDPETGLKLSTVTDVKPYLAPATEFDKKLMIQFGLL